MGNGDSLEESSGAEVLIAAAFTTSYFDDKKAVQRARSALDTSASVKTEIRDRYLTPVIAVSRLIADTIRNGGKILFCGNGGSAADSQHLATEFVVRLSAKRDRQALPAVALTTDTSTLTAAGNDFGFERIFARQVEALGASGDVLIVFSTGGTSPNIIKALEVARERKLTTVGFLGSHIETMAPLLNHIISVPSKDTNRIQESHITLGHIMVDLVECDLFGYPSGE